MGKVGFLSGLMFGGFGASVQAYQENALDKINKKQFALADYLVNSPEARKIYAANLRNEIQQGKITKEKAFCLPCLLYTSPSPRDRTRSRMPSSA